MFPTVPTPRCRSVVLSLAAVLTAMASAPDVRAQDAPSGNETSDACFAAAERAQPLLRQKKLREARALLDVCARDACPKVARSDCREWLAEATDAQPSIVLAPHEVRENGAERDVRDVRGVRAVIDGTLVVDAVDSTPIVVDPGRHRIHLERADSPPVERDVDVREGDKGHIVDVYWRVIVPVVAPTRPVPASVYATAAIGVVALGLGAVFEANGLSQRGDLNASCLPTRSCAQSDVDSARSQTRAGDLLIGGGVLFLAGSAILYVVRPTVTAPDHDMAWIVEPIKGGWFGGVRGHL